uniref:C1q and TNF related 6a n=1 Tax=Labrus bergylta TaxID=56723 RepID=A0A3Q3F1E4_9LABR
ISSDQDTFVWQLLLLLSLFPMVALVPPPSGPPVPCRRCCDHLEPEDGSGAELPTGGFNHVPEVRTYINMTILKVGRRKSLHSLESFQGLLFDTVFVNLGDHFNMFNGKFICHIPGTYLHIMQNETERAIVYAQPSERSIMQSQSLMLELELSEEVWVRLYKRERENAIYSDDVDVYITFNGYLIKASAEGE